MPLLLETIIVSHDERILSEYSEVLLRPASSFPRSDVELLLDFVELAEEHVNAELLLLGLPDLNDLPFLDVREQRRCRRVACR